MEQQKEKSANKPIIDVDLYPYSVSFHSYEDGVQEYEVVFSDFPYVVGGGKTVNEAVEEARGNLRAVFLSMEKDGESIPSPSTTSDDLPSGKVTVRMTKTLHLALIKRSEKEGMSLNSVIVDAISAYVYRPTFSYDSIGLIQIPPFDSVQFLKEVKDFVDSTTAKQDFPLLTASLASCPKEMEKARGQ